MSDDYKENIRDALRNLWASELGAYQLVLLMPGCCPGGHHSHDARSLVAREAPPHSTQSVLESCRSGSVASSSSAVPLWQDTWGGEGRGSNLVVSTSLQRSCLVLPGTEITLSRTFGGCNLPSSAAAWVGVGCKMLC